MKLLDTFAGAGGFSLGFQMTGKYESGVSFGLQKGFLL